jgi:hypothetical protein
MRAQHVFVGEFCPGQRDNRAIGLTIRGDRNLAEIPFACKSILILLEVYVLVGMKIHRIRAGHVRAVIKVRVEHLCRQRLPTAC